MTQNQKKIIYGILLTLTLVWITEHVICYKLELSELIEVTGTLEKKPKFDRTRSGNYIELIIMEDNWRYQTSGIIYQILDINSIKADFKPGQRITFLVSKSIGINEYLDGIVGVVDFYSLKSNEKTYLSLEDYNNSRKENRYAGLFIWTIFFSIYVYNFWFRDKIKNK